MAPGETARAALMFAVLGLAVLAAVYGWIRAAETLRDEGARRATAPGWFAFALLHTSAAAATWHALAFPGSAG